MSIHGRALLLLASVLLVSLPAAATEQAGVSAAVRGQVALSRPQQVSGRQVVGGEPILMQDTIRSGVRSGAQILLLDQTVFTIGPESELVVDEFVYDPATSTGKMSARVAQGVFRFVSGKLAKDHPEDVKLVLPTGTLGIRGTLVAGRVDEATKTALLVLLGEGRENDTGSPAGAIEVCNAGSCVRVRSAGFGTRIGGPDEPPLEPFRVPEEELNALTQSVTDPAGWLGRANISQDDVPAVAAESALAVEGADAAPGGGEGGDVRSPTEISGRDAAAAAPASSEILQQLRDVADIDAETVPATQDAQKLIVSPFGDVSVGGGQFPSFSGPTRATLYDDLPAVAAAGVQTAVYSRSSTPLTDGGHYDFSLTLDLGLRSLLVEVSNVYAPTLGIDTSTSGESLRALRSFEPPGSGAPVVVRESGRFTGGEGPCGGGCDAALQAYVFSGNGRIADHALQSLAIVPPAPASGPAATPVYGADPYVELGRPGAP